MLNGIHKSNENSGSPRLDTVGRPSFWARFYGQRRRARVTGELEGRGGISKIRASVIRQEAYKLCENKTELNVCENFRVTQIIDTTDSFVSMFVVCKKKKNHKQFSIFTSLFWDLQMRIFISQIAFQQYHVAVARAISRVSAVASAINIGSGSSTTP